MTSGNYGVIDTIIDYGFRNDPEIIPSLIVDDGDPKKTKRKILMNPKAKYIGIGVHEHSEYDYVVLILITDRMEEGGCNCSIF